MRQFLAVAAAVVLAGLVCGEEKKPKDKLAADKAAMRERVAKYLDNGIPGVLYSENADTKDGRFLRVFIVGTAPISTVLGPRGHRDRPREGRRGCESLVRYLARQQGKRPEDK